MSEQEVQKAKDMIGGADIDHFYTEETLKVVLEFAQWYANNREVKPKNFVHGFVSQKECNCSYANAYTAKFMCHGRCKY